MPSGIATDDTTKTFFQELMQSRSLVSLYDFENRKNLFPGVGHGRSKFCLFTLSGYLRPVTKGADFVFFALGVEDLDDENRHFTLSRDEIALLNPNTRTCPIFRSKRDMLLTKAIYESMAVFRKEGPPEVNPWGISFLRMFDMTNDSHLFRSREQLERDGWKLKGNIFYKGEERCLPLYEGKMIWHFDHRFGTYDAPVETLADNGKLPELTEEQHADPLCLSMPLYWVHTEHLSKFISRKRNALLGFRDITNAGNLRTAIFTIIPNTPCSNKLPLILVEEEYNDREVLYIASCCSSFVFDYVARQKVGGVNMNFFILKQLPVLALDQYLIPCRWDQKVHLSDWIFFRAFELTYTAWDLEAFAKDCGYNGPPFRWDEERRFLLRCELDAAYFHLYGIVHEDVDYIMETFFIVKRKEEEKYGEYRTKRVILEIYDEMQRAIESGEPYQTRLDPPPADAAVAHAPRTGVEV